MRKSNGYSPFEVILVLFFISIMIIIIYKRYTFYKDNAYSTAIKYDVKTIETALKIFKIKKGRLPKNLHELVEEKYINDNQGKSLLGVLKFNGKCFESDKTEICYDNKSGTLYEK